MDETLSPEILTALAYRIASTRLRQTTTTVQHFLAEDGILVTRTEAKQIMAVLKVIAAVFEEKMTGWESARELTRGRSPNLIHERDEV